VPRLGDAADGGQPPVYDMPESRNGLWLPVEEILEKSRRIESRRIGVPLATFAEPGYPVAWLALIQYSEEAWRIKIGPAGIIQNPKVAPPSMPMTTYGWRGVRSLYRASALRNSTIIALPLSFALSPPCQGLGCLYQ
jgi:hypothetical protein